MKRKLNVGAFAVVAALTLLAPSYASEVIWLFDGRTLNGWTTPDGEPAPQGWKVEDGMIHLDSSGPRPGQIVTEQEFGDFELCFEWKISEGGNSGVKYRVRKYGGNTLGCEYQLLDDRSQKIPPDSDGSTGALYALYGPDASAKCVRPPGEFNHSRIVVWRNHVEHWLNGRKILDAQIGDGEWRRRVAESKFAKVDGFAENPRGRILLQDHNSDIWFRNIRLRPLDGLPETFASQATIRSCCYRVHRRPFWRLRCWSCSQPAFRVLPCRRR